MDIASLSLSLSMQSPIDREICRSCIMEIVPFLCFHFSQMDIASLSLSLFLSLSLSLSLSMQSPIDREICRSHIMEIVPFLCFHHFTDGHSLSLSLSLSLCNLLSIGNMQISYYGDSTISVFSPFHRWT